MDERQHILSSLPGLEGTPVETIAALSRLFNLRQYEKLELCRQGDEADRMWVLGSGQVVVYRLLSTRKNIEIARVSAPALIGFAGTMGVPKRTATLRAEGCIDVLEISAEDIEKLLDGEGPVAAAFRRVLISAVSRQVATTNANIAKLAVALGLAKTELSEEDLIASITLH